MTCCRKPSLEPLLPSLLSVISSQRENDVISNELVEMLGFDEIELVMHILEHRQDVAAQASF